MEEINFVEEINLEEIPFDVDFHPSDNLVATALINGDIHLYRFSPDTVPKRQLKVNAHRDSCRAVRFIDCGRVLLTASADCSIQASDVETGITITRTDNAHERYTTSPAINRLINLTEFTVASGDDDGFIKVWDIRTRSCCNNFYAHEKYISDMTFASDAMKLLSTSGGGTVCVCNLRTSTVQDLAECYELSSVVLMQNGRKVMCGSSRGIFQYLWECFKDSSSTAGRTWEEMNHPVHAMLKLDEDTIITGSENGIINLVGIFPNFVVHPIAEHSGYLVECLAFSHDRKFLGSIAYDKRLKLWDLDSILPVKRFIQRCTQEFVSENHAVNPP
ncbi:hypothetical protein PHAVU_005G015700 [Phaseolus vulgaris]|uniref:Uncharacterized protein n=2 Tax=Phaseolus vulgaris TaxID=3885 RepID=V7BUT7_PHAVU|nr:hypothetical protein PHAVU_005G015700g [Phaseolus vulgaris]ESW20798.1 hypothetical protein PHAVU_005G015700g [Phaseolus vulgaris]